MSSGYNERPPVGGYPQQGYPGQGYAPPIAGPRSQGRGGPSHAAQGGPIPTPAAAGAAARSGPPTWLVWVIFVVTLLNLLITAWFAWQLIQAYSALNDLGSSLSGLGS